VRVAELCLQAAFGAKPSWRLSWVREPCQENGSTFAASFIRVTGDGQLVAVLMNGWKLDLLVQELASAGDELAGEARRRAPLAAELE
jgi:hypothetical protein